MTTLAQIPKGLPWQPFYLSATSKKPIHTVTGLLTLAAATVGQSMGVFSMDHSFRAGEHTTLTLQNPAAPATPPSAP